MPPSSNRRAAPSRRLRVGSAAVTLRDVALAANVAQSTVSRALAADPRISAATRRAVQQVARRLGYAPNAFARGLAGGGADVVAVVIPRTAEYTFASGFHLALLKGISRVLQDAGYLLLLSFLEKRDYVALHRSGLCRGVIVLMSRIGDRQVAALRRRVPAVLIPGDPTVPGIASVNFDVAVPVALAMRRLLEIGTAASASSEAPPTRSFTATASPPSSGRSAKREWPPIRRSWPKPTSPRRRPPSGRTRS
jgi:DNA-binding LacI/PurR family transcriptional regulator